MNTVPVSFSNSSHCKSTKVIHLVASSAQNYDGRRLQADLDLLVRSRECDSEYGKVFYRDGIPLNPKRVFPYSLLRASKLTCFTLREAHSGWLRGESFFEVLKILMT